MSPARRARVPRPVTATDHVELRLAASALRVIALAAVPVTGAAFVLAGARGALGAAIAAGVVAGMFLLSGGLLSLAAPLGPSALLAAALGGYVLRLMLYALLIVLLRPLEGFSHASLAVSAAVLLVVALAWEIRVVSRTPELFWLDAGAESAPGRRSVVESRDPPGPGSRGEDDTERTPA
jgi:ATP synthase protein I